MYQMLLSLLTEPRKKNNICFSDEATFHLNGLVNKHNVRYCSEENPEVTIEKVMESPEVHVCCSMTESGVIGLYFC